MRTGRVGDQNIFTASTNHLFRPHKLASHAGYSGATGINPEQIGSISNWNQQSGEQAGLISINWRRDETGRARRGEARRGCYAQHYRGVIIFDGIMRWLSVIM